MEKPAAPKLKYRIFYCCIGGDMPISIIKFNKREFQKPCLRGISDPISQLQYHHQIFEH